MRSKIAIVRGKFLNKYEMQFFEPLVKEFDITAIGSLFSYHDEFAFPVIRLPSPVDSPEFPYKMPILNRVFIDAHYLWGLEEKLRGFDIVHSAETYFHYTQQSLNAKKRGYVGKVIATVLENIPFNNEGIWGRKSFKKRAREELDHIVALTSLTEKMLITEGADQKKITVISHYVDTNRFVPRREVRGSAGKDLTVLFVGRLERYKGIYDLLEAARLLFNDRETAEYRLKFLYVGKGGDKGKLLERARQYRIPDKIELRSVDYEDMHLVYKDANIFVAPSRPTPNWQEQYCTALLEAQAAGLPIVTTRTGGIPENIGDAGILVQPGDIRAIAKSLKEFILNKKLRNFYGKRARERAVIHHDISVGAKKLSVLYRSLLQR